MMQENPEYPAVVDQLSLPYQVNIFIYIYVLTVTVV